MSESDSTSDHCMGISGAASAFEVLSSMITPAVLISACGLLVLSTSTRLGRVVDRTRILAEKARAPQQGFSDLREQIEWLSQRVLLLRSALTSQYLAIALFVLTSIAIGVVSLVGWMFGWIPVTLELLGALSLLYGSVLLIREARVAIASTLQEISLVKQAIRPKDR